MKKNEFTTKDYIFTDKDGEEYVSTPLLDEKAIVYQILMVGITLIISFYFTIPV